MARLSIFNRLICHSVRRVARARLRVRPTVVPGAAAEIHCGPSEDLERIDVALLREPAKQIDMAAYVLTDRAVIAALRAAADRGVKVRTWRDASEAARLSDFDVEAQLPGRVQGLEIRSNARGGELHQKGYCVDHRLLRTGSATSADPSSRTMTWSLCEARQSAQGLTPSSPGLGQELNGQKFSGGMIAVNCKS
jgi:hypothetical protein